MLLHSFIHSTSTFVELPQALRIDTVPDFQGLPGSLNIKGKILRAVILVVDVH